MKLETIKKDKKKHIIIGSMILLSVVGCITLTTTRAKYKSVQSIKLANGTINYSAPDLKIAIKVSEDGTTYNNSNTIPKGNYTFNSEKSKCRIPTSTLTGEDAPVAEGVTIEYTDGKINVLGVTKKNTRCYVYFDKAKTSQDTIAKLNVKNIKEGAPTFTQVATGAEAAANNGVYVTDDPMYGANAKTYYWRGAATTNHVIFDNKCWRIVRINGDGSIRLIYNGTVQSGNACKGNGENSNSVVLSGIEYNSNFNNNSYAGWSYITGSQRPSEDNPQTSGTRAPIRVTLEDTWYANNITETAKKNITKGYFCNDRNIKEGETWSATGSTQLYAAYTRINEGAKIPDLSCPDGDVYLLTIGMITADEVQFAGASGRTNNTAYYLYNGQYYWTMTPIFWDGTVKHPYMFNIGSDGNLSNSNVDWSNMSVRPVINLRSDVTFNAGSDGTQNNPYIVQ